MIATNKRTMNLPDTTRAVTSVTVSRTSSLREPIRSEIKDDQASNESGNHDLNKRSLSSDKMSCDSMTPIFLYQKGNSLRQNGKTALPITSPNPNNHHPFKIIKQIETSPRTSESNIDPDNISTIKVSQRLKFKHRNQTSSQGGPLMPDHSLMKEPPRDSVTFTPRPPLVKRFSSDQDELISDIDTSQSNKNSRFYQIFQTTCVPRPPISPTRGIVQITKSTASVTPNNIEKIEKTTENVDDDTSGMDDNLNSDCEIPPPSNYQTETIKDIKYRSSLRKGSDSPNQSDGVGRDSPSLTKTVKWNLNTEVKKIPRSRSLSSKERPSKSKSYRPTTDRNTKDPNKYISDQKLIESHDSYVRHCTTLIRRQVNSLEDLRNGRISVTNYKKFLEDSLKNQKNLLSYLQNMLEEVVINKEDVFPTTS